MKRIALLLCCLILFLCGCTGNDKLVIGLIDSSYSTLPYKLGCEIGALNNEDYQIKYFSSGRKAGKALEKGRVDVAILPFPYIWKGISAGSDIRIISFFQRESIGIVAPKEIKTLAQLSGKSIGVVSSTQSELLLTQLMNDNKLELEISYFNDAKALKPALLRGEIDTFVSDTAHLFLHDKDYAIIHWLGDEHPFYPYCDIAATDDAIKNKSSKIKLFLTGLEHTIDEINQDPRLGFEAVSTFFKLYGNDAREALYHTKFLMGLSEEGKKYETEFIREMSKKENLRYNTNPEEVYFHLE